jgi:hypothetical protein
MKKTIEILSLFLAASFFLSGCLVLYPGRKLRADEITVQADGAQEAQVHIRMGGGELVINGGAADLMQANFTFNEPDWKPVIDYTVSGEHGELWVEQPKVINVGLRNYRYEWDLSFNEEIPIDMRVQLGAGYNKLDLRNINLTHVNVEMGAGEMILDLRGAYLGDIEVRVRGGVGEATILLPDAMGVIAEVTGGLGDIQTSGLVKDGSTYTNDAYGQADNTLILDVEAGIGQINLKVGE